MEPTALSFGPGHKVEVVIRRGDIEKVFPTKVESRNTSNISVTQFLPESLINVCHKFEEVLLQLVVDEKLFSCKVDIVKSEKTELLLNMIPPVYNLNRRETFRVKVMETVKVIDENEKEFNCTLRDVSSTGAGFVAFTSLNPKEIYTICLGQSFCNYKRKFEIVRSEPSADGRYFYGVRFLDKVDICGHLLQLQRQQLKNKRGKL